VGELHATYSRRDPCWQGREQACWALLAALACTGASVQFAVELRADGRDRKMSSERAGTRLSAQPYDPCSICGADGGQQHLPRDSSPILSPPPPPPPPTTTAPRDSGSEAWIAYADACTHFFHFCSCALHLSPHPPPLAPYTIHHVGRLLYAARPERHHGHCVSRRSS
jgi:hypothetical protein